MSVKYLPYNETIEFAVEYLSNVLKEARRKENNKRRFEISPEEFSILEIIMLNSGLIQAELAKKVCIQSSYISKLVTKLETLNYIERKQGTRGTRQVTYQLYITDNGKKLYNQIKKFIYINKYKNMPEEEFAEIQIITKKIIQLADKAKETFNVKF